MISARAVPSYRSCIVTEAVQQPLSVSRPCTSASTNAGRITVSGGPSTKPSSNVVGGFPGHRPYRSSRFARIRTPELPEKSKDVSV